jgi:hypothetical protein
MRLSEYQALVEKIVAEMYEVKRKTFFEYNRPDRTLSERNSVQYALNHVRYTYQISFDDFVQTAALDAIDSFLSENVESIVDVLEFEPEDVTGHHPKMLIIDEVSDWPANIEYKWRDVGHTIKWDTLGGRSDEEVTKFYGKSLSSLIEEIESENDAGQLLKSTIHPPITADMAASGPWQQPGIVQVESVAPATPYIPTCQAEPKEEEKPPEDDGWGGNVKPQSAAEDFSAIAKRMKELAAEKGNS